MSKMKKSILFILMLLMTLPVYAQKVSIYGVVSDMQDGSPIVGAAVISKDKNGTAISGATTDIKGEYIITIDPKKEVSLEFSFLGYVSIGKKIDGRSRIDASLEATSMTLESVVVTALGVDRKTKALNYSRQAEQHSSFLKTEHLTLFLLFRDELQVLP